jgi:hypothetical protein
VKISEGIKDEFDAASTPADIEAQTAADPVDMVEPDASPAGAAAGAGTMEIGKGTTLMQLPSSTEP